MENTMKNLLVLSLALFAALTLSLITGCDQDNVSGPIGQDPSGVSSIELRATHNQIRGFAGDLRTEQVTAIARNDQGVAVPDVKIEFAIQNPEPWKGTISNAQTDKITDENGELQITYSVVIEKTIDVVIEAYVGQVTNSTAINIIVVNDVIGSLTMEASKQVLAVPPNQTRQTSVIATLVDLDGNALPGMQVRFRTDPPGFGFVDSDTATTDFNGRATRSFTTIVNKYGICEITAQVGDYTGSTNVEIRPVEAPAFIDLSTSTPEVKIMEGQSAIVNFNAVVTDLNRVGVPGTPVAFEVIPFAVDDATFGALSAPDTTDDEGNVTAVFNSLGKFGKLRIKVSVLPSNIDNTAAERDSDGINPAVEKSGDSKVIAGTDDEEISDEIVIEIKQLSSDIGSLTIHAFPPFLNLPPDSNGISNILVQARDVSNIGIPDVKVDFVTDLGTLSSITLTDESGVASAVFRNNYESGTAHITASIPGTAHSAMTEIVIRQSVATTGTITLNSDKEFIYADNGLTIAALTALLSDEDGQALSGKEIVFTKTHGTVNSPVITDSLGIAHAIFRDVGTPSFDPGGDVSPAIVTAKYNPLGLEASVAIIIFEKNPVSVITLQSAAEQLIAGSNDPTTIRATCFLENGSFAPEGTLVRFEVDNGFFTEDAVPVSGNYGVAETQYTAGSIVGTATLRAFVQNDDENVYSNEVAINLLPGPPSQISVQASPDQLITNDPNSYAMITAIVSDTSNNAVAQGTLIRFETTLGNVTPSAITDSDGCAEVRLTTGVEAGLAEITASVQTASGQIEGRTTVTFISGSPNSIELFADPLHIAVAGTGGISTSTLRAEVRDANGNLVEAATQVVFELLNEPDEPHGCNINNRGQIDSALTANGGAVVSLNAGTQIGGKIIRAYTWRDEAQLDTVAVTLPTIAVVSGPPFRLDIDLNDDGDDALGGAWKVQVSARVYDIHQNPVADNIPVVFTVTPDIATITPGYTGNEGATGASEPGLAYADMFYQSAVTFSPITITAEVVTPTGEISGSKEHILPLQDGVLELHIDPQNWMFDRNRLEDICNVRIWVVLKDGHLALINNAPILFSSSRGKFSWYNFRNRQYSQFFPDPARKLTGVVDAENEEEPGQATVYIRGVMNEFFLDDLSVSADVQIQAAVEGYDEVRTDPGFIYMTRR